MPFSLYDWSLARRRDSACCQPQANTLPNMTSLGGTQPNHMSNLDLLSYNLLHSRNSSNGDHLLNASSRESTPPYAQPDQIKRPRSYDRPGRKPAAPYRRDPLELQKHCKQRGGCDFAVDWIMVVFQHGVSLGALLRTLDLAEIESADRSGSNGFTLHQAYDGFLVKADHHFECGLCEEGKRTHWVRKKDAVRHFRKFHFGLADRCRVWCVFILLIYDR